MPNTTTSPNMNLPVPVVGTDPGPDWANNIVACLSAIDSHNHSTNQGVPVSPNGMNINADLPMGSNNLTGVKTVTFSVQGSTIAAVSPYLGCVYVSGVDLYYNDVGGNIIKLTTGGNVNAGAGSITGLPSGTASASFAGGTYTWRSATNTPATMAVGPLKIGAATVTPKTVTLGTSASQPADYSVTFPLAAPAANQTLVTDGSGNLSWVSGASFLPLGSIIPTLPYLAGAYSTAATTVADAQGFVLCAGQTIADATSPMNGAVIPDLNGGGVFLRGTMVSNGAIGGATSVSLSIANLAAHTHPFTTTDAAAATNHTHVMSHYHQWGYSNGAGASLVGISTGSIANDTFTTGSIALISGFVAVSGTSPSTKVTTNSAASWFTTGSLGQPNGANPNVAATSTPSANATLTGTTNSIGSGTAFSILPTYIGTVFLMRVK